MMMMMMMIQMLFMCDGATDKQATTQLESQPVYIPFCDTLCINITKKNQVNMHATSEAEKKGVWYVVEVVSQLRTISYNKQDSVILYIDLSIVHSEQFDEYFLQ